MSAEPHQCSLCGSPLLEPGGHCPQCLFGFAEGVESSDFSSEELLNPAQLRFFGDYELESEIARGGMGVVYRARQLSLNRPVAIKMILAGQFADTDSIARFQIEAEATAKLDHPHIVPVYELGEHETQHYFTMKLVHGARPVSHWVKELESGPTRFRSIAHSVEKIACAVDYAHARGVLHRDIKPSNILVDADGEPRLTDFGLAKVASDSPTDLTMTNVVLGSPAYMSPEQARGGNELTTAADIYSLGAVLYELLTGRPPFEGATPLSVLAMLDERAPERPRLSVPSIPLDLEKICLKCLEKDPSDRYHSAVDMADDLRRFQNGDPVSVARRSKASLAWRWCLKNPVVSLLTAAVALVLVMSAFGILHQKSRTEAVNTELVKTVEFLQWREIDTALERGNRQEAIAHLAAVLRDDPTHWQAAMFATSILEQHPFPLLIGKPVNGISASALSPDGSLLATGDETGMVRITHLETGALQGGPLELEATVRTIFFHPEAPLIAVSAEAVPVVIFNIETGAKVTLDSSGELRLPDDGKSLVILHDRIVTHYGWDGSVCAAVDPGERPAGWSIDSSATRLAVWSGRRLLGWDMRSGDRLFSVELDADIGRGGLSGDGSRIALTVGTDYYQLIAMDDGTTIARHSVNDQPVSGFNLDNLALNVSGTRAIVTFTNGTSRIFDAETYHPISVAMPHDYSFRTIQFSEDRRRMLLAGSLRRVRLWDLDDTSLMCEPLIAEQPVDMLGLARNSSRLLLQCGGQSSVWQPSRQTLPRTFTSPGERYLEACGISDDGRWAFLGAWKNSHRTVVFDQQTGEQRYALPLKGAVYAHLYHPPTQRYIATSNRGHLEAWSLVDGSHLWGPIKTDPIHPALLTPDGNLVVAGCIPGMIRIFDANNGRQLRELNLRAYPRSLQLFPDGRTLLSAAEDGTVATWDILTGAELLRFKGHSDIIVASAVSGDGTMIATAAYDNTARIWDAVTGIAKSEPLSHLDELSHLAFSPDSTRLVTAARDGNARIWSTSDGAPVTGWMSHASATVTARFSPDGRRVVVRFHDGFRIWDSHTGQPISVVYHSPIDSGLAIDSPSLRDILSPDGRTVRLGVNASSVTIWDITPPPDNCPTWFPDFLEAVARLELQPDGGLTVVPMEAQLKIRRQLTSLTGWHADWARRFLEMSGHE